MLNIIPIMKLKDTAYISKYVTKADEPIFVTKNGFGCMVMMNMKVFESLVGDVVYLKKEDPNKKPYSLIAEKPTDYDK